MLHPPHDGYIDLVSCITTLFSLSQVITFITFLMIFYIQIHISRKETVEIDTKGKHPRYFNFYSIKFTGMKKDFLRRFMMGMFTSFLH